MEEKEALLNLLDKFTFWPFSAIKLINIAKSFFRSSGKIIFVWNVALRHVPSVSGTFSPARKKKKKRNLPVLTGLGKQTARVCSYLKWYKKMPVYITSFFSTGKLGEDSLPLSYSVHWKEKGISLKKEKCQGKSRIKKQWFPPQTVAGYGHSSLEVAVLRSGLLVGWGLADLLRLFLKTEAASWTRWVSPPHCVGQASQGVWARDPRRKHLKCYLHI